MSKILDDSRVAVFVDGGKRDSVKSFNRSDRLLKAQRPTDWKDFIIYDFKQLKNGLEVEYIWRHTKRIQIGFRG